MINKSTYDRMLMYQILIEYACSQLFCRTRLSSQKECTTLSKILSWWRITDVFKTNIFL